MNTVNKIFKERFCLLPVEAIHKAEWNYKEEDSEKAQRLVNNLKRNGQVENVIVRKIGEGQWEVTNGNHRLDAFNHLGWKEIIAYDMGEVSLQEAQRLTVETNEFKFDSNRMQLGNILKRIDEEFEDFSLTTPFSEAEMASYLAIADSSWQEPEGVQEANGNNTSEFLPEQDKASGSGREGEEFGVYKAMGYETAEKRATISKPVQFLEKKGLLQGEVLDYGAGNDPHAYAKFDPTTAPDYSLLLKKYDVVICNDVLSVVPLAHNRYEASVTALASVKPFGKAIFIICPATQESSFAWEEEQWDAFFSRFGGERLKTPKAFWAWEVLKPQDELPI